jgi:hypothetical protein
MNYEIPHNCKSGTQPKVHLTDKNNSISWHWEKLRSSKDIFNEIWKLESI